MTLMIEQVEKLMYELSMWRASPELKVRTRAGCGACGGVGVAGCGAPLLVRGRAVGGGSSSCHACLCSSCHAGLCLRRRLPQARAQAVEARHAAGADGEFLETKKNT